MLIEDAQLLNLWGVQVYAYGLFAALGALACLVYLAINGKSTLKAGTAPVMGLSMLAGGFVLSRLMFVFLDGSMRSNVTLDGLLYIQGGGYSMYGALLGAVLLALLVGKIRGENLKKVLDTVVPALLLFMVFARLGEKFTDIGISRPLLHVPDALRAFVTVGEYDSYISTYLLESMVALAVYVMCIVLKAKKRPDGTAACLGLTVFAAVQTLLESLRFDQHMKFSFVGVQQVLSMVLLIAMVLYFAIHLAKMGRGKGYLVASIVYLVCLMGAVVALEFLIDRSGFSRTLLYILYGVLLALPCAGAWRISRLAEKE